MNQGRSGLSNAIGIGIPSFASKSGDSTQMFTPLTEECQSTAWRALGCEVYCGYAASSPAAESRMYQSDPYISEQYSRASQAANAKENGAPNQDREALNV